MQFSAHNYGLQWESHALKAHQYTFLSELWVWLPIHNYTISLSCLSLVFLSHEFPCPYHVIVRYVQIPRLALSSVSIPHGVPYVSLSCHDLPFSLCHVHPSHVTITHDFTCFCPMFLTDFPHPQHLSPMHTLLTSTGAVSHSTLGKSCTPLLVT